MEGKVFIVQVMRENPFSLTFGCITLFIRQSFLATAFNMDQLNNSMEYRVYCMHKEGWHMIQAVSAARIQYFAAIKRLREELGLHFMKFEEMKDKEAEDFGE